MPIHWYVTSLAQIMLNSYSELICYFFTILNHSPPSASSWLADVSAHISTRNNQWKFIIKFVFQHCRWFAALGNYHRNPWLTSLAYRLLTNETDVVKLLDVNIYNEFEEDWPPKYVKGSLYTYKYTSPTHKWAHHHHDHLTINPL